MSDDTQRQLVELLVRIDAQIVRAENALELAIKSETGRFGKIEKRLLALERDVRLLVAAGGGTYAA